MHYVNHAETGLSKLTFKELPTLKPSQVIPTVYYLDVLWHSSHFVLKNSCPTWSGLMSKTVLGEHPGKATVSFLPILDLNPNDMTCATVCTESGKTTRYPDSSYNLRSTTVAESDGDN